MAKQRTDEEMVTRSIYISKELYERFQQATGQFGVSVVISELAKKWLNREVEISIEPIEGS